MSENKKNNMFTIVIALIICLAVFSVATFIAVNIETIDVTGLPDSIQAFIETVKYIFLATPVAVMFACGRGIYGYAVKWIRAKRQEDQITVDFSLTWLTETVVQFEGFILVVTPLIGFIISVLAPQHKQIAIVVTGALWSLISILLSEIKRLVKDVQVDNLVSTA